MGDDGWCAFHYVERLGPVQASVFPVLELVGQFLAVVCQLSSLLHSDRPLRGQQCGGGLVHYPYSALVTHQQNAGLHVLYDLFIEALQGVEIAGAIAGQLLGAAQPVGDGLHHQGDTEDQQSQQSGGEQGAALEGILENQPDSVQQYGQHGEGGD